MCKRRANPIHRLLIRVAQTDGAYFAGFFRGCYGRTTAESSCFDADERNRGNGRSRRIHRADARQLRSGAVHSEVTMRSAVTPSGIRRLLTTNAPAAVLLIRLMVGSVFLSEGIQKFLFPAQLGVGRF